MIILSFQFYVSLCASVTIAFLGSAGGIPPIVVVLYHSLPFTKRLPTMRLLYSFLWRKTTMLIKSFAHRLLLEFQPIVRAFIDILMFLWAQLPHLISINLLRVNFDNCVLGHHFFVYFDVAQTTIGWWRRLAWWKNRSARVVCRIDVVFGCQTLRILYNLTILTLTLSNLVQVLNRYLVFQTVDRWLALLWINCFHVQLLFHMPFYTLFDVQEVELHF